MEKRFNGKAIYNPAGRAGEYAKWACNFYVGCSNDCSYCYCKKGVLGTTMGQNQPQLKKCFKDMENALEIFEKELRDNLSDVQKHGIFFSFTTDPMLSDTIDLTFSAMDIAIYYNVPVYILTKRADWLIYLNYRVKIELPKMYAFGFTLTGCDELETNASTNQERIAAMKMLHDKGFKTFASIEPIIDIDKSMEMIKQTLGFCDLYKIGLLSGKRDYDKVVLNQFVMRICLLADDFNSKVYFKESIKKYLGGDFNIPCCVNADYNLFTDK